MIDLVNINDIPSMKSKIINMVYINAIGSRL